MMPKAFPKNERVAGSGPFRHLPAFKQVEKSIERRDLVRVGLVV